MGTEFVFVLIYPIALICLSVAMWSWFNTAKVKGHSLPGYLKVSLPLVAGFSVSMAGLALLTYIQCSEDYRSLVIQGYYTESQRSTFLPARVVGEAVVNLVFALPLICIVVVPLTARSIKANRLTLKRIGAYAVTGWIGLALLGWLWNLMVIIPPYPLSDFLKSVGVQVAINGLPIPIAAFLFFRRELAAR